MYVQRYLVERFGGAQKLANGGLVQGGRVGEELGDLLCASCVQDAAFVQVGKTDFRLEIELNYAGPNTQTHTHKT